MEKLCIWDQQQDAEYIRQSRNFLNCCLLKLGGYSQGRIYTALMLSRFPEDPLLATVSSRILGETALFSNPGQQFLCFHVNTVRAGQSCLSHPPENSQCKKRVQGSTLPFLLLSRRFEYRVKCPDF